MTRLADTDWRICVIAAGPGAGKTTFAAQWQSAHGGAWLSIDESVDRPELFWWSVASALEQVRPGVFDATERLASHRSVDVASIVGQFLNDAALLEHPLSLVLEDVHVLRNPLIMASLASAVEGLPPQLRLVVTSRSDPSLPIARWRARSWLVDVRQKDLAFDLHETSLLFAALGEHRLSEGDLATVHRLSEGWAAALVLAASAMRDNEDGAVARAVSASNRMIADLLAEEVIGRQTSVMRDLMMCSSIVDEIDADLCDVLADRNDSRACLEALERETHFLLAVDEERGVYRFHTLLRDLLRADLERICPGRSTALHKTAAEIFEARGDNTRAAAHLVSCGERDRAFDLLFGSESALPEDRSDMAHSAGWLDAFPPDYLAQNATRMLTFALALVDRGERNDANVWLAQANHAISTSPHPDAEDVARLGLLRLDQFVSDTSDPGGIDSGQRALEQIHEGIVLGPAAGNARPDLARAYLLVDDPDKAESVLHGVAEPSEERHLSALFGIRARVALRQGHLRAAEESAEMALHSALALACPERRPVLDARIALVGVLTERNDLASARGLSSRVKEEVAQSPAFVYRVISRLDDVRIAAAHSLDDAFSVVMDLRGILGERERPTLSCIVDASEARLHLDAGETDRAAVLIERLRPGSLAQALLRGRLHLSRGEVAEARSALKAANPTNLRDRLVVALLCVRACVLDGGEVGRYADRAVELASPDQLVRIVLEEGSVVTRLVRTAAEARGSVDAARFATALGSPPSHRDVTVSIVTLTERERAVLRFLPSRLTNQEIGREIFMSVNTVKAHLKAIYSKLGVSTRSAAIDRARLLGEL